MKRFFAALCAHLLLASVAVADGISGGPSTSSATTWPATGNIVLSNGTGSPAGLGSTEGLCAKGAGGVWATGSCGSAPVLWTGTLAGGTTVYTMAATAYSLADQNIVQFKVNATNTGASTLNVNSTGAKAINKQTGGGLNALAGGELVAGNQSAAIYQSSCDCYVLLNGIGANGVVTALDKTATAADWSAWSFYVETGTSKTVTLPVSTTLSTKGGLAIAAIGHSVTLAPNAADAINGGTGGASVTIASGVTAFVTTDGAGNIYANPLSGGSGISALTGDVTASGSGSVVATVAAVNGTTVPASPSTHQTPVVTASNTASWKTIPDCPDSGGNHLNYTQSGDSYSCGTSGSGGGGTIPNWGYATGTVYGPDANPASTTAVVAGTVYFFPISFSAAQAFTQMSLKVTGTGAGTCDMGVYASASGKPTGSPLADGVTGTISSNGAYTASVSFTPTAATAYWGAIQCSSTPTLTAYAATAFNKINGGSDIATALTRMSQTGTYGTPGSSLPTAGATGSNNAEPAAGFVR